MQKDDVAGPAQPQSGAAGLVPHPHRVELLSGPGTLQFPPLCPHCGGAAQRKLAWDKVFFGRLGDDWQDQRHLGHAEVPFCDACIAEHEALVWRPSAAYKLRSLASEALLGAATTGAVALFVLKTLAGPKALFPLALVLLFSLMSWVLLRFAWHSTAYRRVPGLTRITSAFDFSDDVSSPFEPARQIYSIRDGGFAAAFEALNLGRGWDAQGPQAATAARKDKWLMRIGMVALAAYALWGLWGGKHG